MFEIFLAGVHRIYPYLLRGMTIDRPNQVGSADITYIPMARGFLYLGRGDGLVQPLRPGVTSVEYDGYLIPP